MELVIKIVVSAVVAILVFYECVFLFKVWRSQIDPVATSSRILETLRVKTDLLATREPDKLYQAGKIVAAISGRVIEEDSTITFERLLNTSDLKSDQPVEFRRMRLKIKSIAGRTGLLSYTEITSTGAKTITGTDVLGNVICERLNP